MTPPPLERNIHKLAWGLAVLTGERSVMTQAGSKRNVERVRYPKEDVCRHCGTHIGWIMSPNGDAMALGICDRCAASGWPRAQQCDTKTT